MLCTNGSKIICIILYMSCNGKPMERIVEYANFESYLMYVFLLPVNSQPETSSSPIAVVSKPAVFG